MDSKTRIGIIGLGNIGGNVARHLLDGGTPVAGYDIDPEKREAFSERGATVPDSAVELVAGCDVTFTSLPTTGAVRDVFYGEDGILPAMNESESATYVVEMSTVDPSIVTDIADDLHNPRAHLVGAPVSGGASGARNGNLTLMTSGEEEVVAGEPVRSALERVSARRFYTGEIGTGHVVKVINNMMAMGNTLLAMEAIALSSIYGVDGGVLFEVVNNGSGGSNQLRKRMPRVLDRDFDQGFTIDYAIKDLSIATEMADSKAYPLPAMGVVKELYKMASANGLGDEDPSAVLKLFEEPEHEVRTDLEIDDDFDGY